MRGPAYPGRIRCVLFDFDGTLVDASELICLCFNASLEAFDLPALPPSSIRRQIGRPLRQIFAEQAPHVAIEEIVAEYRRVFSLHSPGSTRLLPGASRVVPFLCRFHDLAIVTSRSSTGTWSLLEHFSLEDCFSAVVGVDHVEQCKPSPEPVLTALRRLSRRPGEAVFVGDTPDDVTAGRLAGVGTIGVNTGAHSREDLLDAGADLVIDSLAELPGHLPPKDRTG
jgi:phosphoglycolate phosphatase-like HAD superfamily hydrolase